MRMILQGWQLGVLSFINTASLSINQTGRIFMRDTGFWADGILTEIVLPEINCQFLVVRAKYQRQMLRLSHGEEDKMRSRVLFGLCQLLDLQYLVGGMMRRALTARTGITTVATREQLRTKYVLDFFPQPSSPLVLSKDFPVLVQDQNRLGPTNKVSTSNQALTIPIEIDPSTASQPSSMNPSSSTSSEDRRLQYNRLGSNI